MAMASFNTHERQSQVHSDGVMYFMEKLMYQIYQHFVKQEFVDVKFKLSNSKALVNAHRLILSAASPYFSEHFKNTKDVCPLIEITDIDSDVFERLITFCYTGKMLITIDNVEQMLKAALVLQLEDAVNNCVDFFIEHITDYALQRALTLESENECEVLNLKILEYEIGNFMSVIQSAEFLNYDANKLQAILESDDLNVRCEKDVFEAVKRWYEHDAAARKQQLPDLIACLRLTQFDANFLLANIQPLPGCHILAVETLTWISHPLARSTLSIKYTQPRGRQNLILEKSFLALNIDGGESRTIFRYNQTEVSWHKWVDVKIDVSYCRVIFMNENLIFIGGTRNNKVVNDVSSWNLETKTFKQLSPMKLARYLHCLVILNGNIYVIGGWGGTQNQILQSVEMYSVSNGWKTMKGMITPRYNACAVALNGKIYVMGGHNENDLTCVECYDPTMNCWTRCVAMNEVHSSPGATVHNGQIFVLGGCNEMESSAIVERYDPHINEWTKVCSLSIGRWGLGCISIDNQLWAVGGCDKDYVSVYDEQSDKWMAKNPIPMAGHYYCFTALTKVLLQNEYQM